MKEPTKAFISTILLFLFFGYLAFIRGWHNSVGELVKELHPNFVFVVLIGMLILVLSLDYFFGKNIKKKFGSRSDVRQIWLHSNKKNAE